MNGNTMEEEWRDVAGQAGRYQVSNEGNFRSSLRSPGAAYTAKSVSVFQGKRVVYLSAKGKSLRRRVDFLVRQAFPGIVIDTEGPSPLSVKPCSSTHEVATEIILILKGSGPVIDFNDTKQALYAYSQLKELLTAANRRRQA